MKMWITKYALSGGIKNAEGEIKGDFFHPERGEFYYSSFKVGRDAHDSESAAKVAADVMRAKKIKSLEKQIKALIALKF
jgi:hypothetical protein